MRYTAVMMVLVLWGCTTEFSPGEDTSTTDTTVDDTTDAVVDTTPDDTVTPDVPVDTVPADTVSDPTIEPEPDTWTTDTWEDTWTTDTWEDTWTTDTWTDPGYDVAYDTWTDTTVCVSETASLGGVCNILDQCGCAEGQYCAYYMNYTECIAYEVCKDGDPGMYDVGDTCDATAGDECAPDLICLYDSGASMCYQWCMTDADCPSGTTCSISPYSGGCGSDIYTHRVCF